MDIHSDTMFKSKTDMQLATHALVAASHDPESNYVIVSNDNDFLPLIRSLQGLRRRVVIVTFARRASSITAAADGWIGLNTPKKPGRPEPLVCASSEFQDTCTRLGNCLVRCSGNIFSKLRATMLVDPSLEYVEGFPPDLLKTKGFKRSLAKGFKGEDWTAKEKATVAEHLLLHDDSDLFAQLGFLIKVRTPRTCWDLQCRMQRGLLVEVGNCICVCRPQQCSTPHHSLASCIAMNDIIQRCTI